MNARRVIFTAEKQPERTFAERMANNVLHKVVIPEFTTEQGAQITNLRVAYRVFGKPNPDKSNIILIFHALTGDANCAGYRDAEGHVQGWWEWIFGRRAAIDLNEYCVICPNHPGSCYGASGPPDREVGATAPIGLAFPEMGPRDLARVHKELLNIIGIGQLKMVLGGSLGGMVALEWAASFPDSTEKVGVLAAPAASSAQAIAFNHIQMKCFDLDPSFKGGNYYGGPRPAMALSLARQIAMITYRSPVEFSERFGRGESYPVQNDSRSYLVQTYLDYQGEKLVRRFDPNSYIKLLYSLDAHDITRDRGSLENILSGVESEILLVSIDSDILYSASEIETLYRAMKKAGIRVQYNLISSLHGHDGFLIESEQLNELVGNFLAS